jgi:hypothetical protein
MGLYVQALHDCLAVSKELPMNTMRIPFSGMVTVEREERAYTATWRVHGNKLIVIWDNDEEPAQLGMFEKEPEALARMLLRELLDRKLGKQRKGNAPNAA